VISQRLVVAALLCAVVALAACRRETYYQPLKLGGEVPQAQEQPEQK
jgi:hypothetical protein